MKTAFLHFVFAAVLFVSVLVSAAADVFSSPLTAETAPAFDSVRRALCAHEVQKGDFIQTKTIARLKRDLVSSGTYLISREDGIVWNTQKPYPSTMTVTKRAVIQTAASGKKTVLQSGSNATFESLSAVISSVFQGGEALSADNFDIYFAESDSGWTAGLVPKDSTISAVAASFELFGASGALKSVIMHEPAGDSVRYDFVSASYASSLTEAEKALFSE